MSSPYSSVGPLIGRTAKVPTRTSLEGDRACTKSPSAAVKHDEQGMTLEGFVLHCIEMHCTELADASHVQFTGLESTRMLTSD